MPLNKKIHASALLKERAVFLAIMFSIGLVFFIAFYNPATKKITAINENLAVLKKEIEGSSALIAGSKTEKLEEIKESYTLLEKKFESLGGAIPLEGEIFQLIRKAVSPRPGLSFLSITRLAAVAEGPYIMQPLYLDVRGDFPVIGGYISMLESSWRFMKIDDISIINDGREGLLAKIHLNIYMLSGGKSGGKSGNKS